MTNMQEITAAIGRPASLKSAAEIRFLEWPAGVTLDPTVAPGGRTQ